MRVYPNHGCVHVTVARSRTFRSGNSEALRLPKDVAFGDDVELVLVRSGNVMTIYPAATSIADMLAQLAQLGQEVGKSLDLDAAG